MSRLLDLVFSDLFVSENPEHCWFKATPDSLECEEVPQLCFDEITEFWKKLQELGRDKNDFKITWTKGADKEERMRARRMSLENGKDIFVCRRSTIAPNLNSLGLHRGIVQELLKPDLNRGLVVFVGKPGSGKTTAAIAMVRERLALYGGVGWTVENPVEMELTGKVGKGWLYQREVDADEEIGTSLPGLYRSSSNIIFIGEVRDQHAAYQAILAGQSGPLVVLTFHGSDLLGGLARFARLAGDKQETWTALSECLRAIVHVELINDDANKMINKEGLFDPNAQGTGNPPRVLVARPLFVGGDDEASIGIRSRIENGHTSGLKSLSSDVQRQRNSLISKPVK